VTKPTDRLLSTTEAVMLARVSREYLVRRIQQGQIAATVVAGHYRIVESSLRRWIAERELDTQDRETLTP
jgi:excisionase family DNA binding protein